VVQAVDSPVHCAGGDEKVVELIGPGQSFGEALMFMERPYVAHVQALADLPLLHFAKTVVFDEIEREPGFARKMIAGLSCRLHGLVSDLESYAPHSGAQCVIGYLLRETRAG
jgi:CRP-like cAMP-binding protein